MREENRYLIRLAKWALIGLIVAVTLFYLIPAKAIEKSDCPATGMLAQEVIEFRDAGGTKDMANSLMESIATTSEQKMWFGMIIDTAYNESGPFINMTAAEFGISFIKFCNKKTGKI